MTDVNPKCRECGTTHRTLYFCWHMYLIETKRHMVCDQCRDSHDLMHDLENIGRG